MSSKRTTAVATYQIQFPEELKKYAHTHAHKERQTDVSPRGPMKGSPQPEYEKVLLKLQEGNTSAPKKKKGSTKPFKSKQTRPSITPSRYGTHSLYESTFESNRYNRTLNVHFPVETRSRYDYYEDDSFETSYDFKRGQRTEISPPRHSLDNSLEFERGLRRDPSPPKQSFDNSIDFKRGQRREPSPPNPRHSFDSSLDYKRGQRTEPSPKSSFDSSLYFNRGQRSEPSPKQSREEVDNYDSRRSVESNQRPPTRGRNRPAVKPPPPNFSKTSIRISERLENILAQCERTRTKFTDPEFPPEPKSLYKDPSNPPSEWPRIASWKRVTEISPNAALFISGSEGKLVEPGDVVQGVLGDCWFLGALSVVATREDLLFNLIPQRELNEWGAYEFRFYKDGNWISVIVDDYIPVSTDGKPVFCTSHDKDEVWVMLMEKAYAKLHKCYENLEGGSEPYALVDMTGGAPEIFELDSSEVKQEIRNGNLWERMVKFFGLGYLGGSAMLVQSGVAEANTGKGILQNHAYGILDIATKNGVKLLRIRNPWGEGEWTGAWSDNSREWTPQLLKELNYSFADDGTFWMCFEDFVKQFNRLYFLRLFGDNWRSSLVRGEWKGETAGGCGNYPTWKNNPQYGFQLDQPTDIFITLMQRDVRQLDGVLESSINIGFLLIQVKDCTKPVNHITEFPIVGQTMFTTSREISKKFKLNAGHYVISPSTYYPKKETTFILRVYKHSTSPLELNLIGGKAKFSQLGTTGFVRTAHVSNRTVGDVPLESAQKSPSSPETPTSTSKISKDELKNMSVQTLTELKQQIDTLLEEHTPRTKSTKRPSSASQLNRSTEAITRRVSILTSEDYTFKITQLPSNKRPKQVVAEDEIQEFRVLAQTALKDGNMRDEAAAYYQIAVEYDNSGHYAKAINYYNKFLAVVKEVEDVLAEALAYNRLGSAYHCLGTEKYLLYAIECHRKHEELTSDQGSRFIANCNLGLVYTSLKDYGTAMTHFRQALGSAIQLGDLEAQSLVTEYLARNAIQQGDLAIAKVYLERRLKIVQSLGNHREAALLHHQIGQLLLSLRGAYEEDANRHFKYAMNLAQDENDEEVMSMIKFDLNPIKGGTSSRHDPTVDDEVMSDDVPFDSDLQTQETDWAEDAEGVDEELDDDILDLREISRNKKVVTSLKGLPGHNIDTDEPLSDESRCSILDEDFTSKKQPRRFRVSTAERRSRPSTSNGEDFQDMDRMMNLAKDIDKKLQLSEFQEQQRKELSEQSVLI